VKLPDALREKLLRIRVLGADRKLHRVPVAWNEHGGLPWAFVESFSMSGMAGERFGTVEWDGKERKKEQVAHGKSCWAVFNSCRDRGRGRLGLGAFCGEHRLVTAQASLNDSIELKKEFIHDAQLKHGSQSEARRLHWVVATSNPTQW
jgi:hypothetical protein